MVSFRAGDDSQDRRDKIALEKSQATVKKVIPEIVALYRRLAKALTVEEMPYDVEEGYPLKDAYDNLEGVLEDLGVDLVEWGGDDYPQGGGPVD